MLNVVKSKDAALIGGLLVVAFAAPVIPAQALMLLDTLVVRILLVVGLIAATNQSPVVGIAALITIAMLYMERNRSKVIQARFKFEKLKEAKDPKEMTVEEEGVSQKTVPVIDFEEADGRKAIYLPGADTGKDDFQELAPAYSLNDKRALPTIPIGNKSAPLFRNYLH